MIRKFFTRSRGEFIGFFLTIGLVLFIAMTGYVLQYVSGLRSEVAIAARQGARKYGIESSWNQYYGISQQQTGLDAAQVVNLTLQDEKRIPSGASLSENENGYTVSSTTGVPINISFAQNGDWTDCTVVYPLPNPLSGLAGLLGGNTYWPATFNITVTGAAKDETNFP